VLGIVAAQMTLAFALTLSASINASAGSFFKDWKVHLLSLIGLIFSIPYLFNDELRRTVPYNYMLLGAITIC